MPRPHPLHGCGIITPFRILNAWEAQYCSRVEFLQKRVSPTNNQLQGISLLSMLTFIFKKIHVILIVPRGNGFCQENFLLIYAKNKYKAWDVAHDT